MDVKDVLCMNKGEGESSYLLNSKFTNITAVKSIPTLKRAIESLFKEESPPFEHLLNVADLGCASGSTSNTIMSTVVQTVVNKCRELNHKIPEFQFYLNDLPSNDFNTLFKGLSGFVGSGGEEFENTSCLVMGAPGSFHGRLFPLNTIHLVYSNYSVHWLSKVPDLRDEKGNPINKGTFYISKTSPSAVREAYLAQFQKDFTLFLKSRAEEMVSNGRVVLVLHGRLSQDFSCEKELQLPWLILSQAISRLVSKGLIDEEKLDSFEVPYYTPSAQEVKELVEGEGSYAVELMETFTIRIGARNEGIWSDARGFGNNLRSITETMISHHFGPQILDELYDEIQDLPLQDFATQCSFVVGLKRN
nr:putative caffeine synthase 2 [synthetic construct]